MNALADTTSDALIASWRARLEGKAAEIRTKYSIAQPASVMDADLTHWHLIAVEFARQGRLMSSSASRDLHISRADTNVANLLYLRDYVRQLPGSQLVTRNDLVQRAVAAQVAPIEWLIAIGSPALQRSASYADMVRAAADAPSKGLGYILDQLRKALNLPTWAVPVIAGAAILGVGVWAYFTFLAPVTRVSYAVRRNPAKRKRRRRLRR